MLLAAVKASDILNVIWVSLVAGVFVTTAFSFVVLGSARSAEARRTGQGSAVLWGGVAVLAFLLFAAVVVYGVHIMLAKS
jgi:hypothetical protein